MRDAAEGKELNFRIARRLEEVAQILEAQNVNRYRVHAYLGAAETLRRLDRSVGEIFREGGEPALRELPGVGERLAGAIATLLLTGRLPMLERLRGKTDANVLLSSVPGIGKSLAPRLRRDLGIETLEQLEAAAHDGRLKDIAGLGAKKIYGIIDSLAARLGRVRPPPLSGSAEQPTVAELLDVDNEYRAKAAGGELHRIAPRRFNPRGEAWLPILHTARGKRHYMALFSNTARAHELNRTADWVVVYCDSEKGERQYTIITSNREPMRGKRIVRGRESECLAYYDGSAFGNELAASAGPYERRTLGNPRRAPQALTLKR
jgi:putative hydrolase